MEAEGRLLVGSLVGRQSVFSKTWYLFPTLTISQTLTYSLHELFNFIFILCYICSHSLLFITVNVIWRGQKLCLSLSPV